MDMVCPHLAQYAMLFISTRESPRDFAALLGLMQQMPNLALYDFVCGALDALKTQCEAAGVTLDDRLGAVLMEDQLESMRQFIPLSVPGLVKEVFPSFSSDDSKTAVDGAPNLDVKREPHTESGSCAFIAAHDDFHNQEDAHVHCRARDPKLIKEYRTLNTSRSEQLNRLRKRVDPWLRGQSAHHNLLLHLVLAHRRNRRINETVLHDAEQYLKQLNEQSGGLVFRIVVSPSGCLKYERVE